MCFDDIADGIEHGAEWLDNWGEEHLGLPGMFTDFTSYDGEYQDGSGKVDLNDMSGDYPVMALNVAPGSYTTVSFEDVVAHMESAGEDITAGHGEVWESISNTIAPAVQRYRTFIASLGNSDDNWVGASANAANANIHASFAQLDGASKSATAMVRLSPAFGNTIGNVVREVVHRKADYVDDMTSWPEHAAEIKREYDALAQSVMADYTTNITQIITRNPDLTGGVPTPTNPGPAANTRPQTNYGDGGGGGGGGLPVKGTGTPSFEGLTKSTPSSESASPVPEQASPTTPQSAMPSVPTDALSGATDAAKDAAGQATDAAKQALDQALGAIKGPQDAGLPPEGVLGLGPNGLRDAAARGAGTGGGGRGGGSGAGTGTSPLARNAGMPGGATRSTSAVTPSGARAGLSGAAGSGAPGAGAPAAGHRGNGADGAVHKANKALRRKKNGEDVMGESDAVVAVVGEAPEEAAPAPAPASR